MGKSFLSRLWEADKSGPISYTIPSRASFDETVKRNVEARNLKERTESKLRTERCANNLMKKVKY